MLSALTSIALNWAEILQFLNLAMTWSGYICIAATILVRFTPSKKDDEAVKGISSSLIRVLSLLPTWGLNPNTKKALDTLKEVEAKADEQEQEVA